MADAAVEALAAPPIDPSCRGKLHVCQLAVRAFMEDIGCDDLSLEPPDDRLHHAVVIGVAGGAGRSNTSRTARFFRTGSVICRMLHPFKLKKMGTNLGCFSSLQARKR